METYSGHVKAPQDAIVLFEACRLGILPRVQRRLSEKERQLIKSGSVFVWDEREAGMRRWTDGKSWSASRVNGSFLTYREMEGKRTGASSNGSGHSPGKDGTDDGSNGGDGLDGYRYKPDGLTKQSFSITTSQGQHLHLISYFSRSHAASGQLMQPSSDPQLRHVRPERGMYPESTLQDQTNTPAMTRSPMINMNTRYGPDGSPHQPLTTASTPQYAQPRNYDPYRNRDHQHHQAQAYNWPPSPMHTPPITGSTPYSTHYASRYSPRHNNGQGSASSHHTPLTFSAQSTHTSYPPQHHRDTSNTTAFDRVPPPMTNSVGLPPAPGVLAPAQPYTYPPQPPQPPPPPLPPSNYPIPTSTPTVYHAPPPTSHPSSYMIAYSSTASHHGPLFATSAPIAPESNTLPPFRRGPSPLRERSDSGASSLKDQHPAREPMRGTPPISDALSMSDKGRESPHGREPQKRGMIPSIGALINQTPPPEAHTHSLPPQRRTPPSQPSYGQGPTGYQSPCSKAATRPTLGSRPGSFHGSEGSDAQTTVGRSRPLDDTNVLRKLDGAFGASR